MTGHRLIETYLAEVDRRLPGSRRQRRGVLDELRDGLHEATARHGGPGDADAVRAAVREFGHPDTVGAAMADELRLRLVQRSGLTILGVLVLVGLAWRAYAGLAGFPSSTVPDSWAAPIFLVAVDSVQVAPVVAQAGAVLLVAAISAPERFGASMRLLRTLAGVVVAALAVCLLAVMVGMVTIATPHLPATLLAGAPTAGLMLAMLMLARRTLRHLATAPATSPRT